MLQINLFYNNGVKFFLFILFIILFNDISVAQTDNIFHKIQTYNLSTGVHNGNGVNLYQAFNKIVQIDSAQWFRIFFKKHDLGKSSYIEIRSTLDNSRQLLNSKSIFEWQNTSAYFNGSTFEISLYVAPDDKNIYFEIQEILIGYNLTKDGYNGICGVDDRIRSNSLMVARLWSGTVYGTAFKVCPDKFVSAGHLFGVMSVVIEFNIPDYGGHPPASDQYSVDPTSLEQGDDWAVFKVFPNSNTGNEPLKEGVCLNVTQDIIGTNVKTIGYGLDNGIDNLTQQVSYGGYGGLNGYDFEFFAPKAHPPLAEILNFSFIYVYS
jgi:hypothetical protein